MRLPWKHPGMSDLLRCADGENVPGIRNHVKRCGQCRNQVTLIASAAAKTSPQVKLELNDIYSRLEVQMEAWCSLRAPRLAAAVEFYFGIGMAQRISRDAHELSATEPLFRTFLGKRAADMLAQKLVSMST